MWMPHARQRPLPPLMLYENSDPFWLFEPPGVLDTSFATYTPIDARTVRVEGSVFEQTSQPTIKLEGSKLAGYETLSFVAIRDPRSARSRTY